MTRGTKGAGPIVHNRIIQFIQTATCKLSHEATARTKPRIPRLAACAIADGSQESKLEVLLASTTRAALDELGSLRGSTES